MLPALLCAVALAVDVSRLVVARQQLQDISDASALAAASALQFNPDEAAAKTAGIQVAEANYVLGQQLVVDHNADVVVGGWDEATHSVLPWSPTFDTLAVQTQARRTTASPAGAVPLYFAPIAGIRSANIYTKAVAIVGRAERTRVPVEFMIIQDGSGSFSEEWNDAIDADWGLVSLVNDVAKTGDRTGFAAFSEALMTTSYRGPGDTRNKTYQVTTRLHDFTHSLAGGTSEMTGTITQEYGMLRSASPSGYTNPAVAINYALNEFASHGATGMQRVIVLVSDGMPFGSTTTKTNQYRSATVTAANAAAAAGVRIHTITLTDEANGGTYGTGGADFAFNESLVRNGGRSFRTCDPAALRDLMITVGDIELGAPRLIE